MVGNPDFVFPVARLVVFVDGCFWHGCPRCYGAPRRNVRFWREKLLYNKARDRRITASLRANGWKVLRLWEHDLMRERPVVRRIKIALSDTY